MASIPRTAPAANGGAAGPRRSLAQALTAWDRSPILALLRRLARPWAGPEVLDVQVARLRLDGRWVSTVGRLRLVDGRPRMDIELVAACISDAEAATYPFDPPAPKPPRDEWGVLADLISGPMARDGAA
jgi:hypothetical protein